MERLEFALTAGLVVLIALGAGVRQFRDSRPPIQPAVVYGQSRFQSHERATPAPLPPAAPNAATHEIPLPAPSGQASASAVSTAPVSAAPRGLVQDEALSRLNAASEARLQQISGIGPVLAGRILETRRQRGGFSRWSDLQSVPGIGEKRFVDVRNSFTLEAQALSGLVAPQKE